MRIYISTVSEELESARNVVEQTLRDSGHEPVWCEPAATDGEQDLRPLLRSQIDKCKGLIQLVGQSYGAEPPNVNVSLGRVSYTQYEALYARQRGKWVWYLFAEDEFPSNNSVTESENLQQLQAGYRRRLRLVDAHLFPSFRNSDALEAAVLKLGYGLSSRHQSRKKWARRSFIAVVTALFVFAWPYRSEIKTTLTKLNLEFRLLQIWLAPARDLRLARSRHRSRIFLPQRRPQKSRALTAAVQTSLSMHRNRGTVNGDRHAFGFPI